MLTHSSKWVGLFVIAFVGVQTIHDLWEHLGDRSVPLKSLCCHVLARALCLIAIPVFVYMFAFWVHFALLPISGPGDIFMTPEFREGLCRVCVG